MKKRYSKKDEILDKDVVKTFIKNAPKEAVVPDELFVPNLNKLIKKEKEPKKYYRDSPLKRVAEKPHE